MPSSGAIVRKVSPEVSSPSGEMTNRMMVRPSVLTKYSRCPSGLIAGPLVMVQAPPNRADLLPVEQVDRAARPRLLIVHRPEPEPPGAIDGRVVGPVVGRHVDDGHWRGERLAVQQAQRVAIADEQTAARSGYDEAGATSNGKGLALIACGIVAMQGSTLDIDEPQGRVDPGRSFAELRRDGPDETADQICSPNREFALDRSDSSYK